MDSNNKIIDIVAKVFRKELDSKSSFEFFLDMPFCLQRLSDSAQHFFKKKVNATSEAHYGLSKLEPTSSL